MKKNVWLLTEERPKGSVVLTILERFCNEISVGHQSEDLKILPIMSNGKFTFCYKVTGFKSNAIENIFILPVSGYSSFVDFMLFYQNEKPTSKDEPILLIEETKTDDKESRNTGVYQRGSKFIFTEFFFRNTKKIMLYNVINQKEKPTLTYIFGTRLLLTLDVEIIGKKLDSKIFTPFKSIDELMKLKNSMPETKNGVSVRFKKVQDTIFVSGRLEKGGKLASDPSIGTLSLIGASLRKLGWKGKIVITKHGLSGRSAIGKNNKFNQIAHQHNIDLENIDRQSLELPAEYWKLETEKEKTGTIFLHVICENLTNGVSVYENHGGCERGYFIEYINGNIAQYVVEKYTDRGKYKAGDKSQIYYLPDLVLLDKEEKEILNIEGKKYKNRETGIKELKNFDPFERSYIDKYYKRHKVKRGLVLSGSGDINQAKKIRELVLYLTNKGEIILGPSASILVKQAYSKLSSLE